MAHKIVFQAMEAPFSRIVPGSVVPPTLRVERESDDLRLGLRQWLEKNDPALQPFGYEARMTALIEWQRQLHRAGFIGLSWPTEFGGGGMGLCAEAVLCQELATTSMPQLINRLALYTWGPTILSRGTQEQKARFLPGMLDASEIWCQGFSEPDAGSDLAAVRTRAQVSGDVLVVDGQKVWTSRAELSKWNAMLVRTDPEGVRHSGLSVAIVDMESPGVTVRPLLQMLGEPHFSEVFFDGVEVPLENVLGGLGNGWDVAMEAMAYERGLFVLERTTGLRRRLADLVDRLDALGKIEDAVASLGVLESKLDLLEAQVFRTLAHQEDGTLVPGSSSVDKLFLADVYQDIFATAFDHLSDEGLDDGWIHDLLESRSVSIYSGTSEIQRNVIARRLLGL